LQNKTTQVATIIRMGNMITTTFNFTVEIMFVK